LVVPELSPGYIIPYYHLPFSTLGRVENISLVSQFPFSGIPEFAEENQNPGTYPAVSLQRGDFIMQLFLGELPPTGTFHYEDLQLIAFAKIIATSYCSCAGVTSHTLAHVSLDWTGYFAFLSLRVLSTERQSLSQFALNFSGSS